MSLNMLADFGHGITLSTVLVEQVTVLGRVPFIE